MSMPFGGAQQRLQSLYIYVTTILLTRELHRHLRRLQVRPGPREQDLAARAGAPLGIRTLTLITCGVKTKAFDGVEAPRLPAVSYYRSIGGYLGKLTDGRLQSEAMDARRYARDVVRHVERGAVGEVWVGKNAGVARLAWLVLPWSAISSMASCHFSFYRSRPDLWGRQPLILACERTLKKGPLSLG
ncbi:short-chain dehydrogenase/reductase [Apiospora saccharicola]|uniref:Short-chain dehydrogenase/reductase n=1 Tax=Apiospora saccharicola TaxID=335842 RepID=A0ABR1UFD5_9PEZI